MPEAPTRTYNCPSCCDTGVVVLPQARRGSEKHYGHADGCACYWCHPTQNIASLTHQHLLVATPDEPGWWETTQRTWCRVCNTGQVYREWLREAATAYVAPSTYSATNDYHRATPEERTRIRESIKGYRGRQMPATRELPYNDPYAD